MDIGTNFRFCIVLDMLKKDAGSKCATSWVDVALNVSRGERARHFTWRVSGNQTRPAIAYKWISFERSYILSTFLVMRIAAMLNLTIAYLKMDTSHET